MLILPDLDIVANKTREIQMRQEPLTNNAPTAINFVDANMKRPGFNGNATLNDLFFTVDLDHSYVAGTDIVLHIHWAPSTTAGGNVRWQLYEQWCEEGATWAASTLHGVTQAAGTTAWASKTADITLSGAGKTLNSRITLRLFRNPTDALDTYPDAAAFVAFGAHYTADVLQAG
jgi:hypothetical protein